MTHNPIESSFQHAPLLKDPPDISHTSKQLLPHPPLDLFQQRQQRLPPRPRRIRIFVLGPGRSRDARPLEHELVAAGFGLFVLGRRDEGVAETGRRERGRDAQARRRGEHDGGGFCGRELVLRGWRGRRKAAAVGEGGGCIRADTARRQRWWCKIGCAKRKSSTQFSSAHLGSSRPSPSSW
ncbi:hypothetical protein HDK77DRAFT_63839 [Phyllosticta capitalensis]